MLDKIGYDKRLFLLFLLIMAGETIFFLPFVLARVFRPTFLSVFVITNVQLGTLFSAYGMVAMVSYFFGGPLADKFSPRYLLSVALMATGLGGWVMAFAHSFYTLLGLYAFWGLTTILLFWASLIKATRNLGGQQSQGRAFGTLEAGRGFMAAMAGSIAVGIFSYFLPANDSMATLQEQQEAFQWVILFISCWVMLIGLLIWIFLRVPDTVSESNQKMHRPALKKIIGHRTVWYQAVVVVCAYVGYKITDDFSLLASEVLGFSGVESAQVGTLALWMRIVVAILAGWLADRLHSGARVISWGFLVMLCSGLIIGSGLLPHANSTYYILAMASTCVGVYTVRSLYFTLIHETQIPLSLTGTTVGLISVVGFTPDIFMGPLMGYLLDEYPGRYGHQLVFYVLAGFSIVGWLANRQLKALKA